MSQEHRTEAACLLEQGASYRRRIGLEPKSGGGAPIFAGFKAGAFSLYYGDAPIYHFDREGRWQRAFVAGVHYLKGLDTTVEASDLDATVRASALDLLDALGSARLERVEPPEGKASPLSSDALREMLER